VVDRPLTVLEAAGIPEPRTVNGVVQTPMEGVSMVYTSDAPKAVGRHKTQYFEIFGNRAIYSDGWVAATVHKAPWEAAPRHKLAEDVWELYNVDKDFSEATDTRPRIPPLKELQALFMKGLGSTACCRSTTGLSSFDPAMAGWPDLMAGRKSLTVYSGMTGMMENAFINVKNQSWTITANVVVPPAGANGVILCQGGRFGGWSVYVRDGRPAFTYNYVGLQQYTVDASEPLAPGKATITVDFDYDGNGRGMGGAVTISVDGKAVGSGRVEHTNANIFSADDAADVGVDEGTNVSSAYGQHNNRFTGTIEQVRWTSRIHVETPRQQLRDLDRWIRAG
jgi:arylsulfatase